MSMLRLLHRYFWAILLALALSAASPAQEGSWVGKTILIKRDGVKFGYTAEDGEQVYHGVLTLLDYPVQAEQDGWLKVRQFGVEGWFDKDDAVLLEDAVAYFSGLLEQDPEATDVYNRRATAWQLKGELDIALKDFDSLLSIRPDEPAFWNNRGNVLLLKKDYDRALEDFEEAIRLSPNQALFYHNRAGAWLGKKDYERALADCSEAIRLQPAYFGAFFRRGLTHSERKDFALAIEDYTECLRLDPEHVAALANRGGIWYHQKQHEKAMRDYGQAIKADPQFARAYNDLAWMLATSPERRFRDGGLAITVAQRGCELTSWRDPNFVDTLAAAHAETGQFDRAVYFQELALKDASFARSAGDGARQRLQLYRQQKPYRE